MSDHKMPQGQKHTHGEGCGHATIQTNPAACTPAHACGAHAANHVHGPTCAHTAVPHGDHVDYVVDGHLHHPCNKHCDDHGPVDLHL